MHSVNWTRTGLRVGLGLSEKLVDSDSDSDSKDFLGLGLDSDSGIPGLATALGPREDRDFAKNVRHVLLVEEDARRFTFQ